MGAACSSACRAKAPTCVGLCCPLSVVVVRSAQRFLRLFFQGGGSDVGAVAFRMGGWSWRSLVRRGGSMPFFVYRVYVYVGICAGVAMLYSSTKCSPRKMIMVRIRMCWRCSRLVCGLFVPYECLCCLLSGRCLYLDILMFMIVTMPCGSSQS